MECVSVIEYEIEYLGKVVAQTKDKDEREFYSDKIDSLKFKKSTIQSNIDNGFVTPESYVAGVKVYEAKTSKIFKDATSKFGKLNKHVLRLENRLKIMKKEILEMEGGESAQLLTAQTESKQDEPVGRKGSMMLNNSQQKNLEKVTKYFDEYCEASKYAFTEVSFSKLT